MSHMCILEKLRGILSTVGNVAARVLARGIVTLAAGDSRLYNGLSILVILVYSTIAFRAEKRFLISSCQVRGIFLKVGGTQI